MDAIERCADHVNEENISEVVSRLIQIIRKGVGLPTKVIR